MPYAAFFETLFAFKTLSRHQSHTQIYSACGVSVGIATAIITNYFQPCYPQACLDCFNYIILLYSTIRRNVLHRTLIVMLAIVHLPSPLSWILNFSTFFFAYSICLLVFSTLSPRFLFLLPFLYSFIDLNIQC